jgi:SAM-dependent methyltransferase
MYKLYIYVYNFLANLFGFLFPGSKIYWEKRYRKGKTSGAGSYGRLAQFKADVLNEFTQNNNIKSVIEFGCGDGYQLSLFKFQNYIGLDVSEKAIEICKNKFANDKSKNFLTYKSNSKVISKAELAISLDVIYHLVEDKVFDKYMNDLFTSATKFVIIYSSNFEGKQYFHERDRKFTNWINENISNWEFIQQIKNKYPYTELNQNETSKADFFIYRKIN